MAEPTERPTTGTDAEAEGGETRPQKGGEGGTTRFGMEDGDGAEDPVSGADRPEGEP